MFRKRNFFVVIPLLEILHVLHICPWRNCWDLWVIDRACCQDGLILACLNIYKKRGHMYAAILIRNLAYGREWEHFFIYFGKQRAVSSKQDGVFWPIHGASHIIKSVTIWRLILRLFFLNTHLRRVDFQTIHVTFSGIHVQGAKLQFNRQWCFIPFFPNRIDGMLINITSNSSKPIDINNGTVLLDRQRRFTFEAEENSVALISLQYESGE